MTLILKRVSESLQGGERRFPSPSGQNEELFFFLTAKDETGRRMATHNPLSVSKGRSPDVLN